MKKKKNEEKIERQKKDKEAKICELIYFISPLIIEIYIYLFN